MRVIKAEFARLSKVPVPELVGAVGVYCIWDGKSLARPTYIGEGTILSRLAEHAGRFSRPFDGYVAITGDRNQATAKKEAEILEAVLLYVAYDTDRFPTQNTAPGKTTEIRRIFRRHGTLRVSISGLDPLLIPWQSRPLEYPKVLSLRMDEFDKPVMQGDWRSRRSLTTWP